MPGIISITGNLGADAELKTVGSDQVCNLRVGCKVGYGDRAVSTWWDVSVWGKPAEWAGELRKGDAVTVMGELAAREHNGTTYMGVRAQSVIAHERKERGAAGPASGGKPQQQQQRKPQGNGNGGWGGNNDAISDDIPF